MLRKKALVIAGAVVFALLLVPIPYRACPEWTVVVTDESGHPLPGMLVQLDYENYSVEKNSHEIRLYTDANGRVTFSQQKGFASLLSRCWFTTLSAVALAHASLGPSAYVNVFGSGREGSAISNGVVYFWHGHPDRLKTTVVASRVEGGT